MFILCHAAKNEPRKRAQAFPLGTPSFAALHRGTRETQYQLLMLCLNSCQHERQAKKAKVLLSVLFELSSITRCVERRQKVLLSHPTCPFRVGVFLENANASAENVCFCATIRKTSVFRGALQGSKGHSVPWLIFFRHFFVQQQRNGSYTSASACRRHSVSVRQHLL